MLVPNKRLLIGVVLVFGWMGIALLAAYIRWQDPTPHDEPPEHVRSRPDYRPPRAGRFTIYQAGNFTGGVVSDIRFAASNSDIAYLAIDSTGVYRSQDGGVHWTLRSKGLGADPRVRSLAIDPENPDLVVVATFGGLFRTTDGGESWQATVPTGMFDGVTFDPWHTQRVYADGIVSDDAGLQWRPDDYHHAGHLDTLFGDVKIVASAGPHTAAVKVNDEPWQELARDLYAMSLAIIPGPPVRIAIGELSRQVVLFEQSALNKQWSRKNVPFPHMARGAVADPANPNRVLFATDDGLYRFDTAKLTFDRLAIGNEPEGTLASAVAQNKRTLLAATNISLSTSRDGGATWEGVGIGIDDRIINEIAVSESDSNTIFAAINNGGIFHKGKNWAITVSNDGGGTWRPAGFGIPENSIAESVVIDPQDARHLLATIYDVNDINLSSPSTSGIYETWDGGAAWQLLFQHRPRGFLHFHPTRKGWIYWWGYEGPAHSSELALSTNGGKSFSPIAPSPSTPVKFVAFSPSDANAIAVVTPLGPFISRDSGMTWKSSGLRLPGDFSALAYESTGGGRVLAAVTGGIYENNNFIPVGSDPTTKIDFIQFDKRYPQVFIVGTDHGVMTSDNSGESWDSAAGDAGIIPTRIQLAHGTRGLFYIPSNAGLFIGIDHVRRPTFLTRYASTPRELAHDLQINAALATELLASIVILWLLYGTSLPFQILAQDWPLLNRAAPLLYLCLCGRFRVFRDYRKLLLNTLDKLDSFYRDLPLDFDRKLIPANEVVKAFGEACARGPVLIVGAGGLGKSSLLRRVAQSTASGDVFGGRLPILIDVAGIGDGTLRDSIVRSLTSWGVYLNPAVLDLQIRDGSFVFLIDGLSEVTDEQLQRILVELITLNPAASSRTSAVILASRYSEGIAIRTHPGFPAVPPVQVHLLELGDADFREFSCAYLASLRRIDWANVGAYELDRLEESLRRMPKTPLLLRLAIEGYERSGRTAVSILDLFQGSLDRILKPEGLGIGAPVLLFLLRHIVWKKFVEGGGQREISEPLLLQMLSDIEKETSVWEKFTGRSVPPALIVRHLLGSGLLVRRATIIRFWHDSFEDYLGAEHLYEEWIERPKDRDAILGALLGNRAFNELLSFVLQIMELHNDDLSVTVVTKGMHEVAEP
jgi:photosystem II stability/assembly factor-like uncharacterized protein